MVTPFCLNHTYEGVADEFFPIETEEMKVPTAIIDPVGMDQARKENKQVPEITTLRLGKDDDKVFTELRFRHY